LFCRVRESNETVFPAKSGRRWLDIFGMAWLVLKLYCFAMQIDIPQLMGAFTKKGGFLPMLNSRCRQFIASTVGPYWYGFGTQQFMEKR
jgi:hypothetical protein